MSDLFSGKAAERYSTWGEYLGGLLYRRPIREILKLGTFSKILDAGCGPGILTCKVASYFRDAKVVGIDASDDMVRLARERAERLNLSSRVEFHIHNLMEPLNVDEKFNLVYSTFVMHHVDDPGRVIRNLWEVLERGGVLFIYDLRRRFFIPHGTRWVDASRWMETAGLQDAEKVELKKIFPAGIVLKAVKK